MKKLLLITIALLGMLMVNAQGKLGSTIEDIKSYAEKYDMTIERWGDSEREDIVERYSVSDKTVQFVFLFSPNGVVIESYIVPLNNDTFLFFLNSFNDDYIKSNDRTWVEYYENYLVAIQISKSDDDTLPYFWIYMDKY